ncbi:hypothetical protein MMC30_005674 [Trapelia coarctata]|nr:hypothetical protein [Trapelia coarctata]
MPSFTKALLVSLLASTALAAPSYGTYKHKHHRHSTGTGGHRVPCSSKGPYDLGNSTAVGPTGTGTGAPSAPVMYSTMIVLPMAATTDAAAAAVTSPLGVNKGGIGSNTTTDTATDCPAGTVYVTASNTVTVTVPYGGGSSTAAAAATSTPSTADFSQGNPTGSSDSTTADTTAGTVAPNKPYNTWTAPLVSPPASPTTTEAAVALPSTTTIVAAPADTAPASSPAPVDTPPASSPAPAASSPVVPPYTPPAAAQVVSSTAAAKASATAKAPAPAAPSTTTAATPVSPPSGVKRGLVYNTASLCAPLESSAAISWAYNWGSSSDGLSKSLEYVPMLWGLGGQQDNFVANTKTAIANGAKYIMAFNEPDMVHKYGGSEINPSDAAAAYKQYMQQFAGKAQLGAPAVTNANQSGPNFMGVPWLKEFTKQCNGGCQVDFYPLHWYGWANGSPKDQAKAFQDYILAAKAALGGKPVWVTEFSALPLEDQTVNSAFMDIVLPWLDSLASGVDRYSYFMVSDGSLVQGGGLTAMGKAYLSAA